MQRKCAKVFSTNLPRLRCCYSIFASIRRATFHRNAMCIPGTAPQSAAALCMLDGVHDLTALHVASVHTRSLTLAPARGAYQRPAQRVRTSWHIDLASDPFFLLCHHPFSVIYFDPSFMSLSIHTSMDRTRRWRKFPTIMNL